MEDIAEKRRFKGFDTFFYFLTKYTLFPLFKIYHRAEIVGFRNVPPRGPFILIANHASYPDPWYITALFRARHVRYLVATKWYLKSKSWKFLFDLYGCIPVNPDNMELSTIKSALKVLKRGGVVGIFPEGRVSQDGKLQEFNPGALYIAARAKVPIIPLAICGSSEILPYTQKIPLPAKLKIVIGKPVSPPNIPNHNAHSKEIYARVMQMISTWIAEQLRQFQNGKKMKRE